MNAKTVHLLVRGRVQGVGYRAFVAGEAGRRGLSGFVRNRHDGSVEAVLSGDPAKVDAVVAACRVGPRAAKVETIEVQGRLEQSVGPFVVLPTA